MTVTVTCALDGCNNTWEFDHTRRKYCCPKHTRYAINHSKTATLTRAAYNREWSARNRDRANRYQREWRKRNSDKVAEHRRAYRERGRRTEAG